jgi:hypothetical protein
VYLTSKKWIHNWFSLEMSQLFALLIAASRVKSKHAVISMTQRLTLPYSLDDRVCQNWEKISQLMDGWMMVDGLCHLLCITVENPLDRAL